MSSLFSAPASRQRGFEFDMWATSPSSLWNICQIMCRSWSVGVGNDTICFALLSFLPTRISECLRPIFDSHLACCFAALSAWSAIRYTAWTQFIYFRPSSTFKAPMKNKSKTQRGQGVDVRWLVLLLHSWGYRVQITAVLPSSRFSVIPSNMPKQYLELHEIASFTIFFYPLFTSHFIIRHYIISVT